MHRQLMSEEMMSTTSSTLSSELQNSQQQLLRRLDDAVVADQSTVAAEDPLVTFPESPPVLVSDVSPLLRASPAARPKPLRVAVPTSAAEQRRVSTSSKTVKEAYESSSSSSSSTVSDTQDVLQSLHHGGADARKRHAANNLRARLAGTIVDYNTSENALNTLQVILHTRFYLGFFYGGGEVMLNLIDSPVVSILKA